MADRICVVCQSRNVSEVCNRCGGAVSGIESAEGWYPVGGVQERFWDAGGWTDLLRPGLTAPPDLSQQRVGSEAALPGAKDPLVLSRIRAAERTQQLTCLMCGYEGLMPIVWRPWYGAGWVSWVALLIIFPLTMIFGLGFVAASVMGFVIGLGSAPVLSAIADRSSAYQCPVCLQTVKRT